jgi:hypothetical protein
VSETFSYDGEYLNDPLYQIRLLIGDTDPDGTGDWKFSDQEITALAPGGVLETPSITAAAIALCRRLVARYSALVDVSEGGASAQMSQLTDHYRQLAKDLGGGVSATAVVPVGVFTSDCPPAFTRRMGDPVYP